MPLKIYAQISPQAPPAGGGVSDYAGLISRELAEKGIENHMISGEGASELEGAASSVQVSFASERAIIDALENTGANRLFLNFAGYGFARWGIPFTLARAIRKWRQEDTARRFMVMFHEVSADGSPISTAFWAKYGQHYIARSLSRDADLIWTSCNQHREKLLRINNKIQCDIVPVFSTIGEVDNLTSYSSRRRIGVVFGGKRVRARFYQHLTRDDQVAISLSRLVDELWDIGPTVDAPSCIARMGVKKFGKIPANEISKALSQSQIGLIDYAQHVVTKSSIIAAYLAHGTSCINISNDRELSQSSMPENVIINRRQFDAGSFDLEKTAKNGLAWYSGHSLNATVEKIIQDLG